MYDQEDSHIQAEKPHIIMYPCQVQMQIQDTPTMKISICAGCKGFIHFRTNQRNVKAHTPTISEYKRKTQSTVLRIDYNVCFIIDQTACYKK